MTRPYHEMSAAERLAARIEKNREIERRVASVSDSLSLEAIVARLHERRQRATYGAVAAIVGVLPRGLMSGRTKCQEYSWVVAASGPGRGWPTDYTEAQIHPDCLRQIRSGSGKIIDDAETLRSWLSK